jgi:hypothetical protein
MKIAHLHLQDGMKNKETLICNLVDGSIRYVYYSGWGSSGMAFALSNLQCTLPVDKTYEDETTAQFVSRIKTIINTKSVVKVVEEVNCNITFKS